MRDGQSGTAIPGIVVPLHRVKNSTGIWENPSGVLQGLARSHIILLTSHIKQHLWFVTSYIRSKSNPAIPLASGLPRTWLRRPSTSTLSLST